jgi:hypothetical protein
LLIITPIINNLQMVLLNLMNKLALQNLLYSCIVISSLVFLLGYITFGPLSFIGITTEQVSAQEINGGDIQTMTRPPARGETTTTTGAYQHTETTDSGVNVYTPYKPSDGRNSSPRDGVYGDDDNGPPPVNCQVSSWSGWSGCTYTCGGGTQSRSRSITTSPANGGASCPALSGSQECNLQACLYDFEARGLNSGDESTATPNGIEGTYDNYDVSVRLRNNGPDILYSRPRLISSLPPF